MANNLNNYAAFQNLDEAAKARVRAKVAAQQVSTAGSRFSSDLGQGLKDITARRKPNVDPELLSNVENVDVNAEAIVSRWYETVGSKFKAFYFLEPAAPLIRQIVTKAVAAYPAGIDVGCDELIAISTGHAGEYWKIRGFETLQMVMDVISLDTHCDLDPFKHSDLACMKDNTKWRAALKRMDEDCTSSDGLLNPHQREYIPTYFATVPFVVGNVIALCRICTMCFGAWLIRNQIDAEHIGEVEPIDDGFGSVGGGPITPDEYLWKPDTNDDPDNTE